MIQNFVTMSVLPALDGFTFTWLEAVVIRGTLPGPGDDKSPSLGQTEATPPTFQDQVPPDEAMAQKALGHMNEVLDAVKKPLLDMQKQVVYRLIARSRVLKEGEDARDVLKELTRAQRTLSYLNTQGALLEGEPPTMPLTFVTTPPGRSTMVERMSLNAGFCPQHAPKPSTDAKSKPKKSKRRKPKS